MAQQRRSSAALFATCCRWSRLGCKRRGKESACCSRLTWLSSLPGYLVHVDPANAKLHTHPDNADCVSVARN